MTVHPAVAVQEITEADICEHYHDGEGIKVEGARVVYMKEQQRIKMIFVDFTDADSLRNAMCMDMPFR